MNTRFLLYSGPMGEDEVFATIVSSIVAVVLWGRQFYRFTRPSPMVAPAGHRVALLAAPLMCAAGLAVLLNFLADSEVRGDARYVAMFTAIGAAWTWGFASLAPPLLGIFAREDGLERRNAGAVIAYIGALVALTLCYAGANFGDGPGWGVVLVTALVSTSALLAFWIAIEIVAHVSTSISVERDVAGAVRLATALVAAGVIFARAASGSWVSAPAMLTDFWRDGWPAIVLVALESLASLFFRPSPERPRWSVAFAGVAPGLLYLSLAGFIVARLGWWA